MSEISNKNITDARLEKINISKDQYIEILLARIGDDYYLIDFQDNKPHNDEYIYYSKSKYFIPFFEKYDDAIKHFKYITFRYCPVEKDN